MEKKDDKKKPRQRTGRIDREKTEEQVKAEVNRWLKDKVPDAFHFHYSAFGGHPGVSDRLVVYNGQFISIECKRPGRRNHKYGGMSPAQRVFRDRVCKAGGHYILAYDKHDVAEYFRDHLGNISHPPASLVACVKAFRQTIRGREITNVIVDDKITHNNKTNGG